eukprot:COSAG01_NODE_17762_length_1126_cov_0.788705_3_plen_133_part_01
MVQTANKVKSTVNGNTVPTNCKQPLRNGAKITLGTVRGMLMFYYPYHFETKRPTPGDKQEEEAEAEEEEKEQHDSIESWSAALASPPRPLVQPERHKLPSARSGGTHRDALSAADRERPAAAAAAAEHPGDDQ